MDFNRDRGIGQQVEQEMFELIVTNAIITIFNQQYSIPCFIDVVPALI